MIEKRGSSLLGRMITDQPDLVSPDMRGDHLYDEVQRYDSLSDMLPDNSPVGELGELDFFQLRVHDK
jgi:hypothetical protein